MVTLLIVWGALPFVALTLYAGLAQVPRELVEAASIDGASPWRAFRDVTLPGAQADPLDPHEPLDHLGLRRVHAAVPADRRVAGERDELPDGRLRLHRGLGHSDFGRGAAISILMLLIVAALSVVYVRRMVRMEETA